MRTFSRVVLFATLATTTVAGLVVLVPRLTSTTADATNATDVDLVAYSILPAFGARLALSGNNSTITRSATATCRPNQAVVGGYGRIEKGGPVDDGDISSIALPGELMNVKLTAMGPTRTRTGLFGYTVSAIEANSYAGRWRPRAVALCADLLPGYHFLTRTPVPSTTALKRTTRSCDLANTVPIMAGGAVTATTTSELAHVTLRGFVISDITAGVTADATGGVNWGITATLVCAARIPGYRVTPMTTSRSRALDIDATVNCPQGTRGLSTLGYLLPNSPTHLTGTGYLPHRVDRPVATAYHDPGVDANATLLAAAVCGN